MPAGDRQDVGAGTLCSNQTRVRVWVVSLGICDSPSRDSSSSGDSSRYPSRYPSPSRDSEFGTAGDGTHVHGSN